MADDGWTTLGKLSRGDVFRTADGLLWRRASAYPTIWGEMVTCSAVARGAGPRDFRTDAEVEGLDLPALFSELDELRTLAHDLLLDRDAAYGREVGRGEALAAVEEVRRQWRERAADPESRTAGLALQNAAALEHAINRVRALGPVRPLPPPERLAARCRALEEALRACVEQMGMVSHHPPDFGAAVEGACWLLEEGRETAP